MNKYYATKKASIISITGNIFLMIIKTTIGFISGSQAMIADAANSISDIFASLLTFIGNKIASEPKDKTHNFGHGKAEYVFSLFISISMIIFAFFLVYNSTFSLLNNSIFHFSWFLVIICLTTIIVKLVLFIYTRALYKKHGSILLKVSMYDHRNDCIIATFTLISVLLSLVNIYWVDGIVGIAISLWICFLGIKIFQESYNILMDISMDEKMKQVILSLTTKYEDIKKVADFYSVSVGYKYIIVMTIFVDGKMSTFKSHELADNLEKEIRTLDRVYNATIHVNPI